MIKLYLETLQKVLRLNKFRRAAGTKSMYRDLLYFYTLTTNYQKEKLRILFTTESKRILKNEFSQGGKKSVHWKLLHIDNSWHKSKAQINGKIFHAHELEEWILLKCPYYPK